ncbi:MAG: hypothetical protein ACLR13_01575 [Acutalibacteraceae bacterium]
MKILALDSSAVSASAAVLDDDKVLGEFLSIQSRHSQTLMPMVQQVLIKQKQVWNGLFAVSAGRLFYGSAHWCGMCRNGICTK